MMAGTKRSWKPEGSSGDGAAAGSASQKKKKKQRPAAGRQIINESIDCVASPFGQGPIRTPLLSSDDRDILIDRLRKEVVEKFGFTLSRRVERNDCDEAQGGASFTMGGGGIQMTSGGNNDETDETHEEKGRGKKRRKKKRRRPDKPPPATLADIVVNVRFVVGVNQCTRALEAAAGRAAPLPSLVLLSRDVRPPTILAHIPVLCRQLDIPSLVLPGRASVELGRAVGGKSVAVALFLPSTIEDATIGIPDDEVKKEEGDDGPPARINKGQIQECHRCIDSYVKFALSKIPSASGTT